jgi:hypothetical protein
MAQKKSLVNYTWDMDTYSKYIVGAILLLCILQVGTVFEVHYPTRLVELYAFPWWRFLIVFLVVIGAWWCPRVGLLVALAAFFYLNDMHILTNPFVGSAKQIQAHA